LRRPYLLRIVNESIYPHEKLLNSQIVHAGTVVMPGGAARVGILVIDIETSNTFDRQRGRNCSKIKVHDGEYQWIQYSTRPMTEASDVIRTEGEIG
jgi:hypothetical protein